MLRHFNSIQDQGIRMPDYGRSQQAGRLLCLPGKAQSRSRGLSNRYSTASVKEWEEQVKAGESVPINPKNPSETEDGDAGQAPAWFPLWASQLIY